MTLLKMINEGGQWIAIVILLVLLFSFDIDFFDSAPKRVTDLESKQEQQEGRIQSVEERLSRIEADLERLKNTQSADDLQEQINTLRADLEHLTSTETSPAGSQPEITPVETVEPKNSESTEAQTWYQQRYLWVGVASVLVILTLLLIYVAKRRKKTTLSVVPGPGYKNDPSVSNNRDCA